MFFPVETDQAITYWVVKPYKLARVLNTIMEIYQCLPRISLPPHDAELLILRSLFELRMRSTKFEPKIAEVAAVNLFQFHKSCFALFVEVGGRSKLVEKSRIF